MSYYDDGPPIPDREPSFIDKLEASDQPEPAGSRGSDDAGDADTSENTESYRCATCEVAWPCPTHPDAPAEPRDPAADDVRQAVQTGARDPRGPRMNPGPLGSLGTLAVRKVSEITPTEVRWFWDSRIAYGKLNVLGGPPGVGKSYLTLALATAASRGLELPGDPRLDARPERVVLLSYEDDPEDTIRPRLDLLGADLDRIEVVEGVDADGRRGSFGPEAVPVLAAHVEDGDPVGLVVVDPVSAFIGAGTDEYRGNEVRAALEELRLLAQRHRVAVLLLMHTRKAQADTALNRLSGSGAYGQLIRSGLMAGPIPDDPNGWHALAHVKHNLSAKQSTLAYAVGEDGLAWHGEVDLDGEEVAGNTDDGDRSAGEEASAFLLEVLTDGPVTAKQVLAEARDAGIATNTLKRAKKRLRVASVKQADRWTWELPPQESTKSPSASPWEGDVPEHHEDHVPTTDHSAPDRGPLRTTPAQDPVVRDGPRSTPLQSVLRQDPSCKGCGEAADRTSATGTAWCTACWNEAASGGDAA